jgi:predicted transcriptional regulator
MTIQFDINTLRERLIAQRGRFPEIAKNAQVSHSWLSKFAAGKMRDPRIGSIERLVRALNAIDESNAAEARAA